MPFRNISSEFLDCIFADWHAYTQNYRLSGKLYWIVLQIDERARHVSIGFPQYNIAIEEMRNNYVTQCIIKKFASYAHAPAHTHTHIHENQGAPTSVTLHTSVTISVTLYQGSHWSLCFNLTHEEQADVSNERMNFQNKFKILLYTGSLWLQNKTTRKVNFSCLFQSILTRIGKVIGCFYKITFEMSLETGWITIFWI